MNIEYTTNTIPKREEVFELYHAVGWSSANKLDELMLALEGAHSLNCAYHNGRLVGLAKTISDGSLVVYISHLLVLPEYQGKGIASELMNQMMNKYEHFHQKVLLGDNNAFQFYEKFGFREADIKPMWIYSGADH
ncbi:GNAT family N-acetyltransferase [Vibrio owensii]|uniref:GNAT family N-acetyltransferase n=1 Tax=Vibrio owensii TaxID=696485 RepID=UPI0018F1EB59|nr:GNAT family N-acetyltransferase [Vibrio owensii]